MPEKNLIGVPEGIFENSHKGFRGGISEVILAGVSVKVFGKNAETIIRGFF